MEKYKIDIDDQISQDAIDLLTEYYEHMLQFNIDDYEDDPRRVLEFDMAAEMLNQISAKGKTVQKEKEEETVGGEISFSVTDLEIHGDELRLFITALKTASFIEFSSYKSGVSNITLVYNDLKKASVGNYEN